MEMYTISQGEKREMITYCYNLKMYGDIHGNAGKEGRNGHSITTQTLWKFIRKRREREVFLTAFHHGFEKQIKKNSNRKNCQHTN